MKTPANSITNALGIWLAIALLWPAATVAAGLDSIRTEKLVMEIERIRNRYADVLELRLVRDGREFFATELLDPTRKFISIARLPAPCQLDDWRPWHETEAFSRIACSEGDTTWVRDDFFAPLKLRQKAFVLINARLAGFSPNIPTETRRDLFWALDLAFGAIHGYRPTDLAAANRLTELLDVYLGARQTHRYNFDSNGLWQRVKR